MKKCRWAIGGILALVLLGSATSSPAAEEKAPPEEKAAADTKAGAGEGAVFDMMEISLFEEKDNAAIAQYPMFGGQNASLSTRAAKEVKAYPKLNSKRSLYGSIILNRDPEKPGPATKFYFVLDESGTAEKPAEKAEKPEAKAEEKATAPDADELAVNKSKSRYDRLYFDLNHDLDLTNDKAISPMKDPPKGALRWGGPSNSIVFDTMSVPLGDEKDKGQAVRLLPVMLSYGSSGQMMFMAASARKGEIRLGKKAYEAVLFQQGGMMGRLDRPSTPLILTPVGGPKTTRSYNWMNTLGTIRESEGEFYTISATPSGDKLTVRVFSGERGVFEVAAKNKDIKPLGMVGILRAKESMLPLGEMSYPMPAERAKIATYRLPVGDYVPLMLTVDYGDLQVSLRADYSRSVGPGAKPAGNIEIRKDKPFVLDFSDKPEVFFQGPPKEKTFKPGDEVRLAAVLRIPDKGLLIGGLDDTSKKVGEMSWIAEGGKKMTAPRYASLEPTVVITDSTGKKLAEGKMPFG